MANWSFVTIDANEEALELVKNDKNFGTKLYRLLDESPKLPSILKENSLKSPFARTKPMPEPVEIKIEDNIVGLIHGQYYDGMAVSINVEAPEIPPNHVLFPILHDVASELKRYTGEDFAFNIEGFKEELNKDFFPQPVQPVLYNNTDKPYKVGIVKNKTFPPGKKDAVDWEHGYAWSITDSSECIAKP